MQIAADLKPVIAFQVLQPIPHGLIARGCPVENQRDLVGGEAFIDHALYPVPLHYKKCRMVKGGANVQARMGSLKFPS
jgi:hypothetical protein